MADLDAIRIQDEQAREAEHLAISGLAGYLRAAVEALPVESKLCRTFYTYSERFARLADWPTGADSSAAMNLILMEGDLRRISEEDR